MIAAIDFGASTTKVAISGDDNASPRMVPFGADLDFPTAIYAGRGDDILVGQDAINVAGQDYSRLATFLKQRINAGLSEDLLSYPIIPGHSITLLTAVSRVLAYAFDRAVASAGVESAIDAVILTHPVAWGPHEISLLTSAARAAGITCPIWLLSEPLAVAGLRRLRPEAAGPIAVFDLGASTLDAAILDRDARDLLEPQYVDQRLFGGDDVDEALRRVIIDTFDKLGDSGSGSLEAFIDAYEQRRFDVEKAVRAAKIKLSSAEKTRFVFGHRARAVELLRGKLEAEIEEDVRRCVATLQVGLTELAASSRTLASVIVSGGSSGVPLVRQLVGDLARRSGVAAITLVPRDVNPGHVVALGAVDSALSGVYGPVTAARAGARAGVWSDGDSERSIWLTAAAQYPVGRLRRRIIFLNPAGDFVAAAGEGSRIAVWRGWGDADVRELCARFDLDTVWDRYRGVGGAFSRLPESGEACEVLHPVRTRYAIRAQGHGDDPQCGWLDGRPVALLHRQNWSALVEIGDSYGQYHRQFTRPVEVPVRKSQRVGV